MAVSWLRSSDARGRTVADILWVGAAATIGVLLVYALIRMIAMLQDDVESGDPAGPGPGLLILFVVGIILTAAALGAAIQRAVAARQESGGLSGLLDALEEAAAVTSLDGTVLAVNAPMRARGGSPGQSIERVLGDLLPEPERQLFRVTRSAMLDGFGIEPLPDAPDQPPSYLVTQVIGTDTMLWRLGSRLEGFGRSAVQSSRFSASPFAHIQCAGDGTLTVNRQFARLFGEDAGPAVAALDLPREGGRIVVPGASGNNVLVRTFVTPDRTGQPNRRDIFLFPVDPEGGHRVGLAGMLEALPVALVQLDLRGRILWSNRVARTLLGAQTRLGMPLEALVEGLGRPIGTRLEEAAAGERLTRPEMAKTLLTERRGSVQLTFARMEIEEVPSILVVISDATELEDMKAQFVQSQKMEAVGKLAGGVAHDFNNVLTAIIGNCDLLLLRHEEGGRDHGDLTQIKQNANRAAQLVRQLLAFSRKQTLQPRLLSMRDVLGDQVYLLQRLIGERVTLKIQHGPEACHIRADVQQIEQALMNLVVNARDAMMPEGGEVLVATRSLHFEREVIREQASIPAGDYVEIIVADEGKGIDPEALSSIFEPFFTTKSVGEGTGLGLSTVYGVVKQSGGFIFARNRAPVGAEFTILLPRVDPAEMAATAAPQLAAPEPAADATGRGSVLLVEDEAPVRSFAVRALKLRGYDVTDTESAADALELLADPGFMVDVLVSDVVMPGMDGPTFVREARQLRPALKVVFISGYARDNFDKHLDGGDYLFLPKPFTLNELTLKVKEAVGR